MFAYAGNNPIKYTDPDGRETGKEPECYIGPSTRKMSPQWWMKVDDAVTRFAWRNYGGLFLLPQEPNTIIRTMDGRLITLTESGVAFSNKEKVADCMFFCITFFALAAKLATASNAISKTATSATSITRGTANLSDDAQSSLKYIKNGQPVPGAKGGSTWGNKGGLSRSGKPNQVLPKIDCNGNPITYREWDVRPHIKGVDRGAERIVTGSDGTIWYTKNHYETFIQVE